MDALTAATTMDRVAFAVGAGVLGGILAALLGVGGGIIILPALYFTQTLAGIDAAMQLAGGVRFGTWIDCGVCDGHADRDQ
jgi:uncharacterized membrane protein YfcA